MLTFAACPQCGVDLPSTSSACACGWLRRPARPATSDVPCAHENCPCDAILRLKLSTGWANLCREHYERHVRAEAKAWCVLMRLTDREAQRDYVLQHWPAQLRKIPRLEDI